MKPRSFLLPLLIVIAFGFGMWSGCSVDFDTDEPGMFPCEKETEEEDCIGHFECIDGFCDEPQEPENQNQNQNTPEPEECNPQELGEENYPLEEPLDITEVCDGQDNNCDGEVDIIFCDENNNCPSNPEDPYGATLTFQCNTEDFDPPRCEAFASNTLRCPDPIECLGEEGYEPVPNECGGEMPENQNQNQGNQNQGGD